MNPPSPSSNEAARPAPAQREIASFPDRASGARDGVAPRRRAARLKVLAAFAVAFVLLGAFTLTIRRKVRRIQEDARTPAGAVEAAAATEGLQRLQLGASLARAAVLSLALLALLWDMSAREKIEDELRRSRDEALEAAEGRRVAQAEAEKLGERLSAVLDHVDVGVVVVELDGGLSLYNVAAERVNGAWRDEMERLYRAGTHPPIRADEKTVFASGDDPVGRALKGETVRGEHVFFRTPFRPKGYHLSVNAVPLRDPRGMPSGVVLMFTERGPA
jgi:PAS domain-containing protein